MPLTPEPAATFAAAGASAFLKVTVLPLMFSVEPSAIRLPTVRELVVRWAVTVVIPEPSEAVRPSALRKSALPLTLRSPPVEVWSVTLPAPVTEEAVWLASVASVATPEAIVAVCTPLARSTAFRTSPTVAVDAVKLAPI